MASERGRAAAAPHEGGGVQPQASAAMVNRRWTAAGAAV